MPSSGGICVSPGGRGNRPAAALPSEKRLNERRTVRLPLAAPGQPLYLPPAGAGPEPDPARGARSDMGPVCCKPDGLRKARLQGNGKQMLELFYKSSRGRGGAARRMPEGRTSGSFMDRSADSCLLLTFTAVSLGCSGLRNTLLNSCRPPSARFPAASSSTQK